MNEIQFALAVALALLLLAVNGRPVLTGVAASLKRLLSALFRILKWERSVTGLIEIGKIRLTDADRVRHTHIVGATGSGKTVLIEALIYEDIKRGRGALIIDPKGDRELFERVRKFCKSMGREADLHLLSAGYKNESSRWNPCRLGSVSEIHSKFLNSYEFSEPFYKKACENALLNALKTLSSRPSFHPGNITEALNSAAKDSEHIQALHLDFGNLIGSDWGEILCSEAPKETIREISLLEITRKNEILFVDLPTQGKSVENTKIGKLLLQEIILISGLRQTFPSIHSKIPFSIFIDEFDAFATESFAVFQNKARSSKFMIHLAHQTLSDLKSVSDTFAGKITGNMNVRFIFRQDDPVDAETWSGYFGTSLVQKRTLRTKDGSDTGDASVRESKEYRIHPDIVKELEVGQCIFSVKSNKTLAVVRVPLFPPPTVKIPIHRPALDFKSVPQKETPLTVRS